ncbi:MAG: hypothetical protein HYU39_07720 [Thaumarchaeota archaeon]|nr:hypothetical protein [Nitrososphaerota archaeon]
MHRVIRRWAIVASAVLCFFLAAHLIPHSYAQIVDYRFDKTTFYSSSDSGTLTLIVQNNNTTRITFTQAQVTFIFYTEDGAPYDYTYRATDLPIDLPQGATATTKINFQVTSSPIDLYAAPAEILVTYNMSGLAGTHSRIISTTIHVKGQMVSRGEEKEPADQTKSLLDKISSLQRQVSSLEQQLSQSNNQTAALDQELTELRTHLNTMSTLTYLLGVSTVVLGTMATALLLQRIIPRRSRKQ